MELAVSHPDRLADFLSELRSAFARARPGPAHRALVALERSRLLDAVITQNVDGLHQEAGSSRVVEVHGSLSRLVCLACGHRERLAREGLVSDLDRAIHGLRSSFVPSLASVLPRCSVCEGPARPDFVAFEEPVQEWGEAERLAEGARVLLVVGTHGEVFPAARLPDVARGAGATIVEVSRGPTFVEADVRVEGEAGRVLAALVDRVAG
jgi:NAD-dependent deacetylase